MYKYVYFGSFFMNPLFPVLIFSSPRSTSQPSSPEPQAPSSYF